MNLASREVGKYGQIAVVVLKSAQGKSFRHRSITVASNGEKFIFKAKFIFGATAKHLSSMW